jgi:hypothetical protein
MKKPFDTIRVFTLRRIHCVHGVNLARSDDEIPLSVRNELATRDGCGDEMTNGARQSRERCGGGGRLWRTEIDADRGKGIDQRTGSQEVFDGKTAVGKPRSDESNGRSLPSANLLGENPSGNGGSVIDITRHCNVKITGPRRRFERVNPKNNIGLGSESIGPNGPPVQPNLILCLEGRIRQISHL